MELKASSLKPVGLSPPDCVSDPEEKEVSDDDDDDRNHKHRRQETRSQSSERDALEQVLTRPYRKRNRPFENRHPFRDNESQASETWKSYNIAPLDKDFSAKFEKRRPGLASFPRAPLDLNQRIRANQTGFGDPGSGRGRGRDSGSWNQRDPRFSLVDIASQIVPQGSIPPSLFAGRGFPNISNAQSASWNAFGLIPGIPNGAMDILHPIGLQGALIPPINSSLNMGIPRQRCRDFEERGFCLRGDICPMEHGVNRIVVEDVQSLSQFNLPVSLPSAHLLGTHTGPGSLPAVSAPSTTMTNSKGLHNKSTKPGMADDGLGLDASLSGYASAGGADLYDPDQPLWNNTGPETSSALLALHSPNIDDTESLSSDNPSDRHHGRLCDNADNDCIVRSTGTAVGSQSTNLSVWGRIGSSKDKLDMKEKIDATINSSDYLENEIKDPEALASGHGMSHQGKRIISEDAGSKAMGSSPSTQTNTMRNIRKPSQKAQRSLFVNGIPQKSNKREALFSHFRKFGEVIDIYIPLNSERAFVQFSRKEEAEAALKAPDAVMGNRFIKLWWANRDSIPDDGTSSGSSVSVTPRGVAAASVPPHFSVANRRKENFQPAAPKGSLVHASNASLSASDHSKPAGSLVQTSEPSLPASDHSKPVITNGPKVVPLQKKLDSLEHLKEELRKKQEMLDQKRNDFRRQLNKLEKQATGLKIEEVAEQAAKRKRVGIAADVAKATTPRSSDSGSAMASPSTEMMVDKNKSGENVVFHSPKPNTAMVLQESTSSKQLMRSLAPAGAPFMINGYKLDNRSTAFRIIPPLPTGLENVTLLKEHFSSYGDVSSVEVEDLDACESGDRSKTSKNCSAQITFTTRQSAERAFKNGKCWQGHNLQFMWLTPSNSSNASGGREKSLSAPKRTLDAEVQSAEKLMCIVSEEAAALGNGDAENSERESSIEHMGTDADSQPSPIPKSPKGEVS